MPLKPTARVFRDLDRRLGPYASKEYPFGELLVVRVDVPAIAFTLRWRRDQHDTWRLQPLAAYSADGHAEARLGQPMCGTIENVPLAFLERGIEVELDAWLPDGRKIAVTGLPNPLVIPPKDATATKP